MEQKLIFKDGKFFRGKEEVPVKFGDKEQIALLKEQQDLINNGTDLDWRVHEVYTVSVNWKCCMCLRNNHEDSYDEHDFEPDIDDVANEFDDGVTCTYCKTWHQIEIKNKRIKVFIPKDDED